MPWEADRYTIAPLQASQEGVLDLGLGDLTPIVQLAKPYYHSPPSESDRGGLVVRFSAIGFYMFGRKG